MTTRGYCGFADYFTLSSDFRPSAIKISKKERSKMKYIVHRRFKDVAICGYVNLPAMTECESENGIIMLDGKPLCRERSENAFQYFAENDDGMGMARGYLTQSIQKTLSKRDPDYQKRWNHIWADAACQNYRRHDYDDFWIWDYNFFHADIDELRRVARMIGAKEDE